MLRRAALLTGDLAVGAPLSVLFERFSGLFLSVITSYSARIHEKKASVRGKAGRGRVKRRNQGFLGGALILLLAVGVVKVMGALFKIPLNAVIGDVGMGYFGTAYTIYHPIFSLATAGFPVAIARMVSENRERKRFRDVRRLHAVSIPIFVLLGAFACALMLIGAAPFLALINSGDQNALPAVYALAPAVFFRFSVGNLSRLL